ncbi:MAG: Phosphoesterase, PA-phosphatase related:Prokaryotic diacylglycerol kinase [Patescibacteria group bacterium]|nr:Phosphoesterase, PA-phosphatase related:Prokaryotic diacylglycerol kinase [Patescibacteria group bacterium]
MAQTEQPIADDHAARVHPYTQRGFGSGLTHAVHGVLHVFKHERNARIHLLFAVLAFVLGVFLRVSDVELAAVFFAVILVFLAEIFNTAVERTLDLIDVKENPRIKLIKDMSAGAVLVAATAAVIMGIAIFMPFIVRLLWKT